MYGRDGFVLNLLMQISIEGKVNYAMLIEHKDVRWASGKSVHSVAGLQQGCLCHMFFGRSYMRFMAISLLW